MGISLSKNQSISLEKTAGSALSKVSMGLGWDPVAKKGGFFGKLLGGGGGSIDLDASCLMLDASKNPIDVVWFVQLQSRDGAIRHSGDNRTGEGDGDDETISVDLAALPVSVKYLVFTVNSFTGQTFDQVENARCRLVNLANGSELARFNLSEKGPHTGVLMAYMVREGSDWTLTALGQVASGSTVEHLVADAQRAIKS
ncbi:TerD family protein [Parachitinimonas caeni]|uniref:Tellurium resistance TerZ family protein n=1 Tax=Parachitinimonas caeni TaxID=3031301 RepID=A0ABT7E3N4_9NEIS|nr:TerD family protein [Parachitinimonas caeni]MDK2126932.1 tellurium resistance TerZ family protein [Parachitinimonas caeni]